MKKHLSSLALAAALLIPAAAMGQATYFLDGYTYNHRYNPAFATERGYLSLPAVGGTSAQVQTNLGIDKFLFPYGDGLTTFMNPAISAETFLDGLKPVNKFAIDVDASLFSLGFWNRKTAFTTVELNLKSSTRLGLPKDMFAFMKSPGEQRHYEFGNLAARSTNYIELAVGRSWDIMDKLRVGVKVKGLLGVADAYVGIDKMTIDMGEDRFAVSAIGSARLSSPGGFVGVGTKEGSSEVDFSKISVDPARVMRERGVFGFADSFGAAVDLGASYEVLDGLTVAASVNDLGFLSWGSTVMASTPEMAWEFTGFDNVGIMEGSENPIKDQAAALGEDLKRLVVFNLQEQRRSAQMLDCRLNASVDYRMPFLDKRVGVSALYSADLGPISSHHILGYLNLAPLKWLSFSVNGGYSSFGPSMGAAMSLHNRVFMFYLATDSIFFNATSPLDLGLDGVPVLGKMKLGMPLGSINLGVNFGLSVSFGRTHSAKMARRAAKAAASAPVPEVVAEVVETAEEQVVPEAAEVPEVSEEQAAAVAPEAAEEE